MTEVGLDNQVKGLKISKRGLLFNFEQTPPWQRYELMSSTSSYGLKSRTDLAIELFFFFFFSNQDRRTALNSKLSVHGNAATTLVS